MTAEEQAIAAYEDAASRGFPNGDQIKLQMAIYTAKTASAMAAVAAEPYALVVDAEPVAPVDAEPVAPVDAEPVAPVDAEPVAPVESEGA